MLRILDERRVHTRTAYYYRKYLSPCQICLVKTPEYPCININVKPFLVNHCCAETFGRSPTNTQGVFSIIRKKARMASVPKPYDVRESKEPLLIFGVCPMSPLSPQLKHLYVHTLFRSSAMAHYCEKMLDVAPRVAQVSRVVGF